MHIHRQDRNGHGTEDHAQRRERLHFPPCRGETAETDWLDIVTWRQQAEFVSRYLGKGRKVVVEGAARTRVWEDKDGKKRKAVEFHATQVIPADSRPQSQNGNTGANEGYTPAPMADFTEVGEDEDLPF